MIRTAALAMAALVIGAWLAVLAIAGCSWSTVKPGSPGVMTLTAPPVAATVEVANPLRGAQYGGVTPPTDTPPPGYPLADRYDRFCWTDLEPRQGVYDFAEIDRALAETQRAGYTFGFRIMPINDQQRCTPDYLPRQAGGSYPDFNAPAYMDAARRLFAALGARYAGDPRLGLLDVSLYGCWGEWHESCGAPFEAMTAANRMKLIDLQYAAFPHTRFLMLTEHQDSLDYALSASRELPTGVRVDCLGSASLGGARQSLDGNPLPRQRWRIAPLYLEYCSEDIDDPTSRKPDFARAADDVTRYHASLVGDGLGNLDRFTSYGATDRLNLLRSFLRSGYRYQLVDVTVPGTITPGRAFSLTSEWANLNATYTYQRWSVRFELRASAALEAVWQAASELDLREPFADNPAGGERRSVTDVVTVPSGVQAGTYQLCVRVVDDAGRRRPLALANVGVTSDGAYCLGAVAVAGA